MYKIVHLTTGEYVRTYNTGKLCNPNSSSYYSKLTRSWSEIASFDSKEDADSALIQLLTENNPNIIKKGRLIKEEFDIAEIENV